MTKKNFTTLEVGGDYETPTRIVRIIHCDQDGDFVADTGLCYLPDGGAVGGADNSHDIIRRITIKDYEPEPLDIREGCTLLKENQQLREQLAEAREALHLMLRHSCVADAGDDMKDALDINSESFARRVIASIDSVLATGTTDSSQEDG